MTVNRAALAKQLLPGLNVVFGQSYGEIDGEHAVLFEKETSKRSFEEEVMQTGLGEAPVKTEGSAVTYDSYQETYVARYVHQTIALGFNITEEAIEDNLYDSHSKIAANGLGRSMASTKQVRAANIFNTAFATNGGDGVPLFSASHPTVAAGNQDNLGTGDLSETTLETALIEISAFKDDRGILIGAQAKSIHIPPALQFVIDKILGSSYSTTVYNDSNGVTNVNDINSVGKKGLNWHINHRFTDTDAWFIKTNINNSTKYFERVALQAGFDNDFDTGNMRYKARERYSFGVSDWRGWYGSAGA